MQEGALNKVNTLYGLPRVDTYIHFFCGAKQIIQVGASFCLRCVLNSWYTPDTIKFADR